MLYLHLLETRNKQFYYEDQIEVAGNFLLALCLYNMLNKLDKSKWQKVLELSSINNKHFKHPTEPYRKT